jgi:hypothetical protein
MCELIGGIDIRADLLDIADGSEIAKNSFYTR